MKLETNRCFLRTVTMDDAEEIYHILKQDNVIENLNLAKPNGIGDALKLLEDYERKRNVGTYEPFSIIEKKTNKFIGVFLLKLDLYNEDAYEYTSYLDPEYWNRGIMTEVLTTMCDYFFSNYQIGHFRGYVMEKNVASANVLTKCGFQLEKIFKVPGLEGNILSYLMTRSNHTKR